MSDSPVLRIFSYLPNPRLAKAAIAARLAGVTLEVRGASPRELAGWLWDFDARPLRDGESHGGRARAAHTGFGGSLQKTDSFLAAHPFGTVPAAWSPDGAVGIFESNSILRAVARVAGEKSELYGGGDPYLASRIDSFLDASLVFARDVQLYLLKLDAVTQERARAARDTYMGGIDQALAPDRTYLVGDSLTLADICFAAELTLFSAERANHKALNEAKLEPLWRSDALPRAHARTWAHFERLCAHPAFAPELGPYLAKFGDL